MSVDAVVHALSVPHRRELLRLLRDGERSAGDLAKLFPISRPAVSQHLGVLRAAGLVEERRVATRRLYRARPEGLVELRAYLNEFWSDRLTRLKAAAEAESQQGRGHHDG